MPTAILCHAALPPSPSRSAPIPEAARWRETATVNPIAGIATFSNAEHQQVGNGYTLTVASSGLTGATSTSFDIVAGAATQFAVAGSATQTAGTASVLTLTALDAQGNIAASYTGSKSVTFSGASSSLNPVTVPTVTDASGTPRAFGTPTTIAFTNGVATAVDGKNGLLTLYRAEAATIDATDGTISAASTLAVQVTYRSPTASLSRPVPTTVSAQGFNRAAGRRRAGRLRQHRDNRRAAVALSIGANPGNGNPERDDDGDVGVNGIASYLALSIDLAGSGYTLVAASSGLTAATSSAFNLSPGQATRLWLRRSQAMRRARHPVGIQPVV